MVSHVILPKKVIVKTKHSVQLCVDLKFFDTRAIKILVK